MILGFSDATISVLKRGDDSVREQGVLCRALGPQITSHVYKIMDDGYEMEMLDQPWSRGGTELSVIWAKLETQVWMKPSVYWNDGWLSYLIVWSRLSAPWITEKIRVLYPEEPTLGYSLIHGDPTLANLMMRGQILVVTDPMPRMRYRQEIPNRREVDWGKMLQSAAGWEWILGCPGPVMRDSLEVVLDKLAPADQRLALLWGAVHLARVARRAPTRGRTEVGTWAEQTSRRMIELC